MYLVDSNVILDIVKRQEPFFDWSVAAIEEALLSGVVYINPIIYAEVSITFASSADLDQVLETLTIQRHDLPWEAAHLAGQAFVRYRRQGGTRTAPLPDFYIGADASVSGYTLLTRDVQRYRTYFPELSLIAPV